MSSVQEIFAWLSAQESFLSAVAAILAVLGLVYAILRTTFNRIKKPSQDKQPKKDKKNTLTQDGHHEFSLAVLLFETLSSDPEDEYLARGISAEIIAHTTTVKNIRVTALTTSYGFRPGRADIEKIADQTHANYVLSGSLQRHNDQIEVIAHLTDIGAGTEIWAAPFNRQVADVFSIQHEISSRIVGSILGQVKPAETGFASGQTHANLDAWGLVQKAYKIWLTSFSRDGLLEACDCLREAIKIDPDYTKAKAVLAMLLAQQLTNRLCDDYQACADETRSLAEQAHQAAPNDLEVLALTGVAWQNLGEIDRSLGALRKVMQAAPLYLIARGYLAMLLSLTQGRAGAQEALDLMTDTFDIAPKHPSTPYFQFFAALAEQRLGNEQASLDYIQKSLIAQPGWTHSYFVAANTHANKGEHDSAQKAVAKAVSINPFLSRELYIDNLVRICGSEETAKPFIDGLLTLN